MATERRKRGAGPEARKLGLLIVYLRMEGGLLQKELARLIGVSDSRLSDWEWGKVHPQGASLDKVAAAFGLERSGLVELAGRLHRMVERGLARLRTGSAGAEVRQIDRPGLVRRIEVVRRQRRDLEIERAEIDETLRQLERDENYLHFQLRTLDER